MKSIALYISLFTLLILSSCGSHGHDDQTEESTPSEENDIVTATINFQPVDNTHDHYALKVPDNAQVDILFTAELDSVTRADGKSFPAKDKQDYLAYIPIDGSSENGYLFVNHEDKLANPNLGDAGGMSWFEVKKENGKWITVDRKFNHIDFEPLGGTWHNCGGAVTPHGTILTAEEYPQPTNARLYNNGRYVTDTSDFKGMKRHEVTGWMVEVDIATKKPLRKLLHMGRYSHEDAHCMPDGKTVYLTDDYSPAVFFKFVADNAGDYTTGQLYAFQEQVGQSGNWLALPMDTASMINAREEAVKLGATLFIRHEWVEMASGKIYITETGRGDIDWSAAIAMGGQPASYFTGDMDKGDGKYSDPYGRVLEFDPTTDMMRVYVDGGEFPNEQDAFLSAPDGLSKAILDGKEYLVVCEDGGIGNVHTTADGTQEMYNEVYLLEAGLASPTLADMIRLTVGPRGCEQTGPIFTPDYKTLFLSVQSPDPANPEPYNRTNVVAITGLF